MCSVSIQGYCGLLVILYTDNMEIGVLLVLLLLYFFVRAEGDTHRGENRLRVRYEFRDENSKIRPPINPPSLLDSPKDTAVTFSSNASFIQQNKAKGTSQKAARMCALEKAKVGEKRRKKLKRERRQAGGKTEKISEKGLSRKRDRRLRTAIENSAEATEPNMYLYTPI